MFKVEHENRKNVRIFKEKGKVRKGKDLTGKRVGKLLIVNPTFYYDYYGRMYWECLCDCGNSTEHTNVRLTKGFAVSCGCQDLRYFHGDSDSPEYNSWTSMRRRCLMPDYKNYKEYGGRGIQICERWLHHYPSFLEDMGRRPTPEHTLDRIDVNGDYEPDNCRWATPTEQSRNTRTHSTNTSGHRGVSWNKTTGSWQAYLYLNHKQINLGYHNTIEEAVEARRRGEKKYWE